MNGRRDPTPPIAMLPHEIVSCILDLLRDEDFCAARRAHRVFWICDLVRSLQRRRKQRWLRMSPERAAALGRTDVLQFLRRHERIPRTFSLWREVEPDGNPDLVRLAIAWNPTPAKIAKATQTAARKGHLDALCILFDVARTDAVTFAYEALSGSHHDVLRFLYAATPTAQRFAWFDGAIARDLVDATRFLIGEEDRPPLGAIANTAARLGRINILRLIQEIEPAFSWDDALRHAIQGDSAAAICVIYDNGVGERPDLQALFLHAARHDRYKDLMFLGRRDPSLSLQSALDIVIANPSDTRGTLEAICNLHVERGGSIAPEALFGNADRGLDLRPLWDRCAEHSVGGRRPHESRARHGHLRTDGRSPRAPT
ncbi:hypothetical protein psal_cds_623 [Pandoravirus salinus]|uniref:Ankyrin repeat domain containing protein n=1 Tax=Pandoravirus salinus TaxID=1349410 RepID=S4VV86_9VIRU|nr:hypothetical protein psal_cds_623 [Pandoravirus salinus]AGO84509.2 hypothetical protein psal_cds_623 [Pandoravirus salinus]